MESSFGWLFAATVGSAAVLATARLLALLIVLRGTRPEERAPLVRALAVLFGRGGRPGAPHEQPADPPAAGPGTRRAPAGERNGIAERENNTS
jgi:hypothetical protein